MWPLVAVAIPAFAGLAAAWFLRERGPVLRSTKVKDLMVSDVVTIDPSATLAQAARLMRDHNVGILPVIEDTKLAGVITDRDLVVRALAQGGRSDTHRGRRVRVSRADLCPPGHSA
jgi:CBS domain-containing protein